jgi:hypothetical protein
VGAVTAVTAASASPLGFAAAVVTTVIVELRPARTPDPPGARDESSADIWWGEGLRCR